MVVIIFFPEADCHILFQLFELIILQNDELLIGRGFQVKGQPFLLEDLLHILRHFDGVAADLKIQVIGKKGIELNAQKSALRQQGAALFHGVHKVLRLIVFSKHHRLAAEGADVKNIAEPADVCKGHIALKAHQAVAQSGPVHIQGDFILPADSRKSLQLSLGIKGPVLRRMGNVDHSRKHHMFIVVISIKIFQEFFQHLCRKLTILLGQHQHLMSIMLDSTCLMGADMTGLCSNDAFIILQHSSDDYSIGLGSADQEFHIRIFASAGRPDLLLCTFAVRIQSISGHGLHIGFRQPL